MIRKTNRQKQKTNDKLFKAYRLEWLWKKFFKADDFVPVWPWEM